jgi:hypothetical protein
MAVRSSMAALISRVRLLINDPTGDSQQFSDQDIQDVLDESRVDYRNEALRPSPTYISSTLEYLDYYHAIGGWEDNVILKQYLTIPVTPATSEPIAGHWTFSTTTLPPVCITGSLHDVYRAAADLLERLSARYVLAVDFTSDGQSFKRSGLAPQLQSLARSYRMKQRAINLKAIRSDLAGSASDLLTLQPTEIDYMGSGDGR